MTSLNRDDSDIERLKERCQNVRAAILDQADVAGIGHYGPAFSVTEILVALYYGLLDVDAAAPDKRDRDRFVLSKGHACSALYPILVDKGFFDESHLATFTRLGSILGDHPDRNKVPGVDFSSGSLGHGLSIGAGMAEGVALLGLDSRVAVVIGDGEQNEGQIWEAAAYAGHRRLSNLLAICDRNQVCVDGRTEDVMSVEPMADRWKAFGWSVEEVDGHDLAALLDVFKRYDERRRDPRQRPTFVIAHTISGKGVDFIEDEADWHLGYLAGEDLESAAHQIGAVSI